MIDYYQYFNYVCIWCLSFTDLDLNMIMMSALGGLWLCVWWEVEEVDRAVHLSSGGSDPEDGRWRQRSAESPALGSLALNAE